jgi:hypothetical protein
VTAARTISDAGGPDPARPPRVSAWSVWLPLLAGAAGFGLVIALALLWGTSGGGVGPVTPGGRQDAASAPPSPASAPAAEVQPMHNALHDIAARCPPGGRALAQGQQELQHDVDLVLAFANQYPNIQVTLDDESGTSLSLLIATRADLRGCAPTQTARVDAAIPAEFRDGQ